MKTTFSALVLVGTLVIGSPASAGKRTEESKRHMTAANAAFALSDYPHAIEEFKKAYEAKPDARILYNLGLSYMKLYELGSTHEDQVQARDYFKRFLALSSARQGMSAREQEQVTKMRSLADGYLATLSVEPTEKSAEKPGDKPANDAAARTPPSEEGQHPPGEAKEPGKDASREASASPPQLAARTDPQAKSSSSLVAPVVVARERSSVPTILFIGAGATGAAALVLGAFAIHASNEAHDLAFEMRYGDANSSSSRARALALTSDALTAATLIAAGIGVILMLVDGSG
jgi:hypothetical protein